MFTVCNELWWKSQNMQASIFFSKVNFLFKKITKVYLVALVSPTSSLANQIAAFALNYSVTQDRYHFLN